MWRWLRRLLLTVLVLLLLAVVAIQIILSTDLPRQLVVDQLGKQTGLKVEIDELSTGWSGHTTLRGLRLYLPGANEPMITLDSGQISHSGLIALAIGGSPDLFSLDAYGVSVIARESSTGQWNLQQMISLIGGDAGSGPATSSTDDGLRSLEHIHVRDLKVDILDTAGRQSLVEGIEVKAKGIGPGALDFDVSSDGQFSAQGQVVMRGDWSHVLNLTVTDAHGFAGDWLADLPEPLSGELRWEGVTPENSIRGSLKILQLALGDYQLKGTADVTTEDSVSIKPKRLHLAVPDYNAGQFILQNGEIALHGDHVSWQRVRTQSNGIAAELSGQYSWLTGDGHVNGAWTGDHIGSSLTHSGSLQGKLSQSFQGLELLLDVSSTGRREAVSWTGEVKVTATGSAWNALAIQVKVPDGSIQMSASKMDQFPQVWPIRGLSAKGNLNWPNAEILELSHRLGGEWVASGHINMKNQQWHAELIGREIPVEGISVHPLDLRMAVEGNTERILVTSMTGAGKYFKWSGDNGELVLDSAQNVPISMNVVAAAWSPDIDADILFDPLTDKAVKTIGRSMDKAEQDNGGLGVNGRHTPSSEAQSINVASSQPEWSAAAGFTGRIRGTLFPPKLIAIGTLAAGHLRAHHQPVNPMQLNVRADMDEKRIVIKSKPFDLFKGTVELDATVGLDERTVAVNTRLAEIQLSELLPIIDPKLEMEGRTSADLAFSLPKADPSRMSVEGDYDIKQFKYGETTFEKLTGKLRTKRVGRVELRPIRIVNGRSRAAGRMVIDLREGAKGEANLTLERWPIAFDVGGRPSSALVGGDVTFDTDLIAGSITGTFNAQADVVVEDQRFATLKGSGNWNPKQVEINLDESSVLGGTVRGKATISLEKWWTSHGELTWNQIDPNNLKRWLNEGANMKGATEGTLVFGPAADAKPPEPLRVEFALKPTDTFTYRDVPLGSAKATLFAGEQRILLDDLNMEVAGGQLSIWASVRRRDSGWHNHFHFQFKRIDLDKLRLAFSKDKDDAVPGRLSGTANFFGRMDQWAEQAGQGTLLLSESNLANTDIVGAILSRVGASTDEPKGKGLVEFALQRGQLNIRRLIFRNGANEVLLSGRVADLRRGLDSPIAGQAVATLRPLRDINLPLLDDADQLLRAFQSNATTFRIEGRLGNRQVVPAAISDLKSWIERTIESD